MLGFHKLHGLGNHFVFFDEVGQDLSRFKKPSLIKTLCDSRHGLGADGVIFIMDPRDPKHHCRMQYFNADASEAEICGNALRGVAHIYRSHLRGEQPLLVETLAGLRSVEFESVHNGQAFYRVEMGSAMFDLTASGELAPAAERKALVRQGETFQPIYVNVGNPHAVLFLDQPLDQDTMLAVGAWLETHSNHPRRMNIEFVEIVNPHDVRVTVWERGCGMTQACGTGATAVAAAGIKEGRLQSPVTVHMPGGDLHISQNDQGTMFMTGPVQEVASGQLAPSFLHNLVQTAS